ncbi:MAG TPA: lasso RiPP family leader peptide-containing protein [Amycolatopsis sp.]|nr:lasso RiPP family leader peptide-containing protein [Amycolatopsis sp.]
MKKEYVAPIVEDLGSVEELTLGQHGSMRLDADFPSGTLFGDLTFS